MNTPTGDTSIEPSNNRSIRRRTTLDCPCGARITGTDEDDLVRNAVQHLKEAHPHLSERYDREHILFMAH